MVPLIWNSCFFEKIKNIFEAGSFIKSPFELFFFVKLIFFTLNFCLIRHFWQDVELVHALLSNPPMSCTEYSLKQQLDLANMTIVELQNAIETGNVRFFVCIILIPFRAFLFRKQIEKRCKHKFLCVFRMKNPRIWRFRWIVSRTSFNTFASIIAHSSRSWPTRKSKTTCSSFNLSKWPKAHQNG